MFSSIAHKIVPRPRFVHVLDCDRILVIRVLNCARLCVVRASNCARILVVRSVVPTIDFNRRSVVWLSRSINRLVSRNRSSFKKITFIVINVYGPTPVFSLLLLLCITNTGKDRKSCNRGLSKRLRVKDHSGSGRQ